MSCTNPCWKRRLPRSGGRNGRPVEADDQWAPQINLGVPVLIPEAYVPDLDVRLGLYRRLIGLSNKVELEGFAAELIDRFGTLPERGQHLDVGRADQGDVQTRGYCKMDGGPKGATLQFHNDKFASPQGLAELFAISAVWPRSKVHKDRCAARLGERQ